MSDLGNLIKEDINLIFKVSDFFWTTIVKILNIIFSFIGKMFKKALDNSAFFFGLLIPLLCIILFFAKNKKHGMYLFAIIFAWLIILLVLGIISGIITEIIKRIKQTTADITQFNRLKTSVKKGIIFFRILGNVLYIIIMIVAVILLFLLLGLYHVFIAGIKFALKFDPEFIKEPKTSGSTTTSESTTTSGSTTTVPNKPTNASSLLQMLRAMFKKNTDQKNNP